VFLLERLENDFKVALKAKDGGKVSILRMLKASIKNKEIEKKAPLSDEDLYEILNSFVKRGKESIEQFSKAGRDDLVEKEKEEIEIIRSYLPEQLSEDEIRKVIQETIKETDAKGIGDLGKVMKIIMPKVKGRADGRLVNSLVREVLQGR
jgi:hypothetical protein